MDLYAENILDHYKHPRHAGRLKHPTISRREENASCGDDLLVDLEIELDVIKDVAWEGKGCAISQAAMSLLSEELKGKTCSEVTALKADAVLSLLGVPVGSRRTKCALLCLHTLKNAIRIMMKQSPQSWLETVGLGN